MLRRKLRAVTVTVTERNQSNSQHLIINQGFGGVYSANKAHARTIAPYNHSFVQEGSSVVSGIRYPENICRGIP